MASTAATAESTAPPDASVLHFLARHISVRARGTAEWDVHDLFMCYKRWCAAHSVRSADPEGFRRSMASLAATPGTGVHIARGVV